MNAIETMSQKELKEYYAALTCVEGTKAAKWTISGAFEIVKLSDGKLYKIEKHQLETSFCFGYDVTEESERRADSLAADAKTYEAFLAANLETIARDINRLEKAIANGNTPQFDGTKAFYSCNAYVNGPDTAVCVFFMNWMNDFRGMENTHLTSVSDLELIIAALKRKAENVRKRCLSYWKKYGASKLNVWTYYRD